MDVPKMSLADFRQLGLLQEVNRQFFHPRGLALAIDFDEAGEATGVEVWDGRDDPEGWVFFDLSDLDAAAKAVSVTEMLEQCKRTREERFGWVVQPIGDIQKR